MSYTVPTLFSPKVNVSGAGTSVNYWADVDANQLSSSVVSMMSYINTLSGTAGDYATLSGNLNTSSSKWNATSASYWASASSFASTTGAQWAPTGGVFNVTGSLSASVNIEFSSTFYVRSPNGNRWAVTIGNDGVLSSALAP